MCIGYLSGDDRILVGGPSRGPGPLMSERIDSFPWVAGEDGPPLAVWRDAVAKSGARVVRNADLLSQIGSVGMTSPVVALELPCSSAFSRRRGSGT